MATAKSKKTGKETETASVKDKANETPVTDTQETETTQQRDLANVTPVEDEFTETETDTSNAPRPVENDVVVLASGFTATDGSVVPPVVQDQSEVVAGDEPSDDEKQAVKDSNAERKNADKEAKAEAKEAAKTAKAEGKYALHFHGNKNLKIRNNKWVGYIGTRQLRRKGL